MNPVTLLLIEDDDRDATYVERLLVEGGGDHLLELGEIRRAATLSSGLSKLAETPDAVLLDLNLPDSEGLETVEAVVSQVPHVPVVVLTGSRGAELGSAAIQRGAQDYLRKGHISAEVLHRTLRYAIERQESHREIVELNRRLALLNQLIRQDLRDDLQMVVGRGDELQEYVPTEATESIETLLAAANTALSHTETAGELMRTLSPEHEPASNPHDVVSLVETQVERARTQFDATIGYDAPDETARIETPPALGSAIFQLLANAVVHTDDGHPVVHVSVELTPEMVRIRIADEGVGISTRQRNLLNDPEARYHEDSGISTGLYLVLTVVEQANGDIEFAPNQPRGTVVTLQFPRA